MTVYKPEKGRRTYEIALTGVMLALSVVVLFFASIVPGIELSVLALSGMIVLIIVSETSIKRGILFFAASVILSFIIIPNKSILLIYGFIFGPYSIFKSFVDIKIKKRFPAFVIKLLFFNIFLAAGFLIFRWAFFAGVELPDLGWYLILAGAQIMLVLYDVILTMVMRVYDRVIPEKLKGKR